MFVALVIQDAKCMPCVVFSSVASPALMPYFSKFSYKRHYFLKNVIDYNMCFYFLYNAYLKRLSI